MSFMMKATVFLSLRILWCNAQPCRFQVVKDTRMLILPIHKSILIHLNAALVERAKQHGLRMATYEEVLKLKKSEATRVAGTNQIPLFRSNEIIFVDKSVTGEDILTFMKSIYSEYKPQDNPALLHPRADRHVGIYYLPKGEEDKTKAQYLIGFRYMARNDWKETMLTGIGSTGKDTSAVERDFVKILDQYDIYMQLIK